LLFSKNKGYKKQASDKEARKKNYYKSNLNRTFEK